MHLAVAAVVNALWDLWGKLEGKPIWRLLCDMSPEQVVSLIDFRYITDALTPDEALDILRKNEGKKEEKIAEMIAKGVPAYTTSCGWLGYSDERIRKLCKEALADGFTMFKVKVGADIDDDVRRVRIVREEIGPNCALATDANQRWDVPVAISWMDPLYQFNIKWIEEPTSPDDVIGHEAVQRAVEKHGCGVATGEHCQNRVIFKQLLQRKAISYCQIDSCRLGGVNEILAVMLMAAKFGVPVCPHAGGVGLCEHVQHLSVFDYACIAGTTDNRVVEWVDHLHEHFVHPAKVRNGHYVVPHDAGYSIEMKPASLAEFEYPNGDYWVKDAATH
eukprot:Opistho-2@49505